MSQCECGCGGEPQSGLFLPGHDQKLRTDIERRVGGLIALRELIITAESYYSGDIDSDTLTQKIRATLKAAHRD